MSEVTFDSRGVTYSPEKAVAAQLAWGDLSAVEIVTTDDGPFVEDVFWIVSGDGRELTIPQSADGLIALVERLQQLPGFDNDAVISAMSSATNQRFLCWHCGK